MPESAQNALQSYLSMITGVGRATRAKASAAANDLLSQAGLDDVAADAQQRITRLTDEIVTASRANRTMLQNLIRSEVEKALPRLRFARAEDVTDLRAELDELQARLDQLEADRIAEKAMPTAGPVITTPAKKAPAKKAPAKKAPAKQATAVKKSAPVKKSAAKATAKTVGTAKKATPAKASSTRKTAGPRKTAGSQKTAATKKAAARG